MDTECIERKFRITTDSMHHLPVAANLLEQKFDVSVSTIDRTRHFTGKGEERPSFLPAELRTQEAGEETRKGFNSGSWGRDPAVPCQS